MAQKKQKIKKISVEEPISKRQFPMMVFDDRDTAIISFPAGWHIKKYSGNGEGGQIVLVRK